MSLSLKDIRPAVWAGIGFLNAFRPGWRRKINLSQLDLSNGSCCVLGEVYGSYDKGVDRLSLDTEQARAMGFVAPKLLDGTTDMKDYPRLTEEWRAAYRHGQRQARRAKAARA